MSHLEDQLALYRIVSTHDFHVDKSKIAEYRAECARLGGACATEEEKR